MAKPPAPAPHDALVDAIVPLAFAPLAVLPPLAAENDVSLTQLRVLGILRDRRLGVSALAGYLGLEKSTMSGLLDRAERRGLVVRAANADDARGVDVTLSRAGAALVDRQYARIRAALAPLTHRLAAADQRHVQRLLEQMLHRGDG